MDFGSAMIVDELRLYDVGTYNTAANNAGTDIYVRVFNKGTWSEAKHITLVGGTGNKTFSPNANMSRAQGINVDFNKVLGLMISNGLVALASALYCQYQGFADVNAGRGAIVIGLAAVIIGEVVFSRIFRNFALKLLSVALGAVIYYIVIQFVLTAGLNTNDLKLITALVVAIFLAIPYWKGKYFRAAVKTKKEGR